MQSQNLLDYVNVFWDQSITPALIEYIKIPNKSPAFDADWRKHGFMDQAVQLITAWFKAHAIPNTTVEVIQSGERTPVILVEIPGQSDQTILLYGHMDKQPEMRGWDPDLGPWKPVMRGDKLYGRGAADDGYAAFASLTAVKALKEFNQPHARCVILIEACEESGSMDLPFYIDLLKDRIREPSLVICLDSGCGNYEQLWITTSLRGVVGGVLRIEVLKEGVHSGAASGIVPSCFRILRELLNRVEDQASGDIILEPLHVTVPKERLHQADEAAKVLKTALFEELPFVKGVKPEVESISELILRRTWRPALSIIGCEGFPSIPDAGNVTLPAIAVKLSLRLPPTVDPEHAIAVLQKTVEQDPPYHAKVRFEMGEGGPGWDAPKEASWLKEAAAKASHDFFGKPAMYMGEGGSIPFMGMLGKKFPQAQFMITGVLGPASNAHGPNEFLHIPTAKKLSACIAEIIAAQYRS